MCNPACINFGKKLLKPEDITSKRIIELGSLNVNGSLKEHITQFEPLEYIGVDINEGKGVDIICKAEDILGIYGPNSFDLVISTEMVEHIFDWKKVINNMKKLCKCGGKILITTRSHGFPLHGWPFDHWRFETYDMKYIFSDFNEHGSVVIEKDNMDIGVFVMVQKPKYVYDYRLLNLDDYRLYNIVYDLRI